MEKHEIHRLVGRFRACHEHVQANRKQLQLAERIVDFSILIAQVENLQISIDQIARLVRRIKSFLVVVDFAADEFMDVGVAGDEAFIPGSFRRDKSQERKVGKQRAHHVDVGKQVAQEMLQQLQVFVV